jgi:hypothetical protein
MLDCKARRAVPLACHVSRPNHTIEQRLGALSSPTSRLDVESFKTLAVWLGLSGASPHQNHTAASVPPAFLQIESQLICFYAAERFCVQFHMVPV